MTKSKPLLGKIIKKIASKIGARVIREPEWNIVGQIQYPSGKKRYFKYSSLDLNTQAASEIAKDKGYSDFFMKQMGYETVPGKVFYSDSWAKTIKSTDDIDAAYNYAKKIGFPLIVKPNNGSQGVFVTLIYDKNEFYDALKSIFREYKVALVQKYISGKDYRVVVLDDKVISTYRRIPLNIIGDGKSTIIKLLKNKQEKFIKIGRDTVLLFGDPRIPQKLSRQGLNFESIPEKGKQIFLLDNANLSSGGDSVDVTREIHPKFVDMAINLTRDMGLRLCGVDLMVDGDISNPPEKSKYKIIEINSSPGLDHYVKIGKEQQKIVENLYLEVLKSMER